LMDSGLVRETGKYRGKPGSGRMATGLEVDPGFGLVLGIEAQTESLRWALVDLYGEIADAGSSRYGGAPGGLEDQLAALVASVRARMSGERRPLVGVGIGLSGSSTPMAGSSSIPTPSASSIPCRSATGSRRASACRSSSRTTRIAAAGASSRSGAPRKQELHRPARGIPEYRRRVKPPDRHRVRHRDIDPRQRLPRRQLHGGGIPQPSL
jgi:hypothetical protein